MSLRLRLIVAFFLFSVVPLAAVTFYSYTSNLRALQVAAQHETEMLTGELTQRMQVVTTQVSDRVERLMDMPVAASTAAVTGTSGKARSASTRTVVARATPAPAVALPAAPAPPPAPSSPATAIAAGAIDPRTIERQVAGALGEVAMLLNNVEVRGLGRLGGRGPAPPPPGTAPRGTAPAGAGATDGAPRAGTLPSRPVLQDGSVALRGRGRGGNGRSDAPGTPAPQDAAGRQGPPSDARRGPRGFRPDVPPPGAARDGTPAAPGVPLAGTAAEPSGDPTHMKLDLTPIRRELFREMAPNGTFETMTPEERQRVGREVNQRLLGIVQGIQLGAAELQKKAEAATQQAAAERVAPAAAAAKALATNPLPPARPGAANVPAPKPPPAPSRTAVAPAAPAPPAATQAPLAPRTATPPVAPPQSPAAETPAAPPTAAPPPVAKPMTRKAALTGNQLNVGMERDGEVVRQVNAEINLPNLLATVFANTRRDSGEIPFAVGKDGHLYAPNEADRAKLATLDVSRVDETPGTKRAGNWIVVTMPDRSGAGLRFGIARPVGDLLNDLRRTTARNAGFGLLFIAIALAGMVPLSGRLTRNLTDLTDGVGRIAQGDYSARVPVKSRDEIGRLGAAFNRMAADVERHQRSAVEQERIRRELELGRRIQEDMLPRTPLHFGLTEVKGISVPAREVGGDFFNYFQLDSGLVALLVGDVSGKGVGAALLMANIQASLRTRFALGQGLSAIAEAIDRDIEANSPGPVYATLFIAIFDPATRRMRYVNAGHNPQFVLRGDDRPLEKLSSTGLPVGMLAGHGYAEREIQLAPGDLLFFYTDGCVEMENEAGDMFGSDRLESLVAAAARGSAEQVLATVEGAIATFRGGRDLFDDATMMAVTVG
jgi:serine phosphatase RsbU (regulator of sigma subunit)